MDYMKLAVSKEQLAVSKEQLAKCKKAVNMAIIANCVLPIAI
jgi:hypothetical protein